jgi:hypothetical protein
MSLDIEKMKADGVDPKIIDFVQLSEDELYNKIARRLENDSIFRDFMTGNGDFNSYAVAAGLITEAERKWLADENNPYKPQTYRVTFDKTNTNDTIDFDYIDITIGESITLPGSDQTYWYTVNEIDNSKEVGYGTQSYTPTENITLYGIFRQEV